MNFSKIVAYTVKIIKILVEYVGGGGVGGGVALLVPPVAKPLPTMFLYFQYVSFSI